MKKIFKTITTIAATLCAVATFTACEQANTCNYDEASNTLSCPDKVYKTVKIANKIWTAENMAVYIPDSSSCYDNNHANCESTGRLYTWNAANNNLCPTGWTLPTLEDYKVAFADKNADALKDAAGFNLQFAGFKYYDGKFADKDASASFWTSDKYDDSRAYLARVTDTLTTFEHYNKNIFASVRCIKK